MPRSLPPKANLVQLKKQAKDLLKAHHAGDAAACETLRLLPRLSEMTDEQLLAADVGLQEAQHALAKDYGFANWALLKGDLAGPDDDQQIAKRDAVRAKLMAKVTFRPMTREDIPAARQFDRDVELQVDEINAQYPTGGHATYAGGPWSDDLWLAEHFEKYQAHGGMTLLAEDGGRMVGFADLWPTDEPEPFGRSLNVECVDYFREYYLAGLEIRLLQEAEEVARQMNLPALDIGTNTCSGEFVSLRRFGLRVFYDYDNVLCRCRAAAGPHPELQRIAPETADLSGLIKATHWSPTDFTFRAEGEPTYMAECCWPDKRAIVELWRNNPDGLENLPVPEYAPETTDLYVQPEALTSTEMMSEILAECAALAGELGAEQIELPCPGDVDLDGDVVDIVDRQFAFAWLRKRL